jgi:hypothetical protein
MKYFNSHMQETPTKYKGLLAGGGNSPVFPVPQNYRLTHENFE